MLGACVYSSNKPLYWSGHLIDSYLGSYMGNRICCKSVALAMKGKFALLKWIVNIFKRLYIDYIV